MRNFLLVTTAVVLVGASPAMAVDTTTLNVQTFVEKACTAAFTDGDGAVALPADSSVDVDTTFKFECNFSDDTASISFASTNGGVEDTTQNLGPHDYTISTSLGGPSGLASTGHTETGVVTSANSEDTATISLQLVNDIDVAGTYDDVLTITIAAN